MQRRWTYAFLLAPLAAHLAFTACAKDDGMSKADASADGSAGSAGDASIDGSAGDASADGSAGSSSDAMLDGGADVNTDACPPYDLKSYDGSTDGLCPAGENTGCFCFEKTQGGGVECDPNGAGCVLIPSNCERCGWLDCTQLTTACAAVYQQSDIDDANQGPAHYPCVSDLECQPGLTGSLCNVRIGNRMFCSDP
ncbi:MAG: hypothetical protein R3B13_11305 [Polyangiaceae bacterium]